MAAGGCFVVCEPLCFVRNRYGKATTVQLIEILSSFYDVDKLATAKKQLCDDIDELKLDKWPRPSRRRDSGNRAKFEADDIVSLFSFLDEKLLIDKLPNYVCQDIDCVPTSKWFDGDLQLLLSKINTLENAFSDLKDVLRKMDNNFSEQNNNMNKQLNDAFEKMNSTIITSNRDHEIKLSNIEKVIGSMDHCLQTNKAWEPCCAPVHPGEDSSDPVDMRCDTQDKPTNVNTATGLLINQGQRQRQAWADRASLPAAVTSGGPTSRQGIPRSRYTVTDSVTADSEYDSGQVFTEVSYHRSSKKRKTDSGNTQLLASAKKQSVKSTAVNVSHNKVIGKHQTDQDCKLKASGVIIEKLVYCVSNVSEEYNCDDVCSFLADNNVKIVSCFDSKTKFSGSKAFRVCIASKYKEQFLSPDMWPEDVIIREWFFKGKQTTNG
jgi:hypothetical protein